MFYAFGSFGSHWVSVLLSYWYSKCKRVKPFCFDALMPSDIFRIRNGYHHCCFFYLFSWRARLCSRHPFLSQPDLPHSNKQGPRSSLQLRTVQHSLQFYSTFNFRGATICSSRLSSLSICSSSTIVMTTSYCSSGVLYIWRMVLSPPSFPQMKQLPMLSVLLYVNGTGRCVPRGESNAGTDRAAVLPSHASSAPSMRHGGWRELESFLRPM